MASSPPPSRPNAAVDTVRRFNRFYTRRIGVLEESLLHSSFSLPEARVIFEIAQRGTTTATALGEDLGLDAGYLSRLLHALHDRGVLSKRTSKTDARKSVLSLTKKGRSAFGQLDSATGAQIQAMLNELSPADQQRLLHSMRNIESLLADSAQSGSWTMRNHRPGDMGWITHRQAVLYHEEYGWNEEYEALIARIMADFVEQFDADRERCWVAERAGEIIGSVFVVRHPLREGVAKLRLLYVEPSARGLGVGKTLVQQVTRFARAAGYHTLTLWTNSVLVSARRLYEAEGYVLVAEEAHHSFGKDLVGQTWELAL